jgi:hypothetical protein
MIKFTEEEIHKAIDHLLETGLDRGLCEDITRILNELLEQKQIDDDNESIRRSAKRYR